MLPQIIVFVVAGILVVLAIAIRRAMVRETHAPRAEGLPRMLVDLFERGDRVAARNLFPRLAGCDAWPLGTSSRLLKFEEDLPPNTPNTPKREICLGVFSVFGG